MSKTNRYKDRRPADPSVYQKKYQPYSRDVDLNKFSAVVAFFPPLFWWPLWRCPESEFGRVCANQGLWLLILGIFDALLTFLLSKVWPAMLGAYYWYELVGYGILTLIVAFMFNGFMRTYDGRVAYVPLLGKIRLIPPASAR